MEAENVYIAEKNYIYLLYIYIFKITTINQKNETPLTTVQGVFSNIKQKCA